MIYVPDLFEDLVTATNTALQAKGFSKTVLFDKGRYTEIVINQTEKDKAITKKAKYPLIWLVKDFEQIQSKRDDLYCEIPKCKIVIATDTQINYSENDRKAKTFEPILYPVTEEFLRQLSLSRKFCMPTMMQARRGWWERSYWGEGKANVFNDFADIIELDLKLEIKNTCVSTQFQTN